MSESNHTMKKLTTILIALCLLTAPVTFTGCNTPQTREAIVFYTFKDIQTIVHKTMDVFAEKVVRGDISAANKAKVEAAYKKYQDAFRLAFIAASNDLSVVSPVEVQKLADELIKLIYLL